jgi:hypothetical protein
MTWRSQPAAKQRHVAERHLSRIHSENCLRGSEIRRIGKPNERTSIGKHNLTYKYFCVRLQVEQVKLDALLIGCLDRHGILRADTQRELLRGCWNASDRLQTRLEMRYRPCWCNSALRSRVCRLNQQRNVGRRVRGGHDGTGW